MPHLTKALALTRIESWTVDWLAIWAFFIGAVALSVASFVYFVDDAPVAAACVLAAYAAIIGVVLRETSPRR